MKSTIFVKTSFFQVESGEDDLTNPNIFGQDLAKWLADRLAERGESVLEVFSEDWGWCIMLRHKPYKLWVGCGNRAGGTDEWGIFVTAEPGILQVIFRRGNDKAEVERVYKILQEIAREIPDATKIWIEED